MKTTFAAAFLCAVLWIAPAHAAPVASFPAAPAVVPAAPPSGTNASPTPDNSASSLALLPSILVRQEDEGQTITVPPGHKLTVNLSLPVAGGYHWCMVQPLMQTSDLREPSVETTGPALMEEPTTLPNGKPGPYRAVEGSVENWFFDFVPTNEAAGTKGEWLQLICLRPSDGDLTGARFWHAFVRFLPTPTAPSPSH